MKIEIREDLIKKLEKRAKEKDMNSVEEYIENILEQVVERLKGDEKIVSKEEEKVKERLRALGYI